MPEQTANMTLREQLILARSILGKRVKAVANNAWGDDPENYAFEFIPTEILMDEDPIRVRVKYRDINRPAGEYFPAAARITDYSWELIDG